MNHNITQAEYQVMNVLWDIAPLAATDIKDRLCAQTSWSVKTVKTLLSRLVEKNAVTHEKDGRRFLYSPLITRNTYAQSATRRLADRLFGGRAAPLVAHLAEANGLTTEDIDDLEALLGELKRERD